MEQEKLIDLIRETILDEIGQWGGKDSPTKSPWLNDEMEDWRFHDPDEPPLPPYEPYVGFDGCLYIDRLAKRIAEAVFKGETE